MMIPHVPDSTNTLCRSSWRSRPCTQWVKHSRYQNARDYAGSKVAKSACAQINTATPCSRHYLRTTLQQARQRPQNVRVSTKSHHAACHPHVDAGLFNMCLTPQIPYAAPRGAPALVPDGSSNQGIIMRALLPGGKASQSTCAQINTDTQCCTAMCMSCFHPSIARKSMEPVRAHRKFKHFEFMHTCESMICASSTTLNASVDAQLNMKGAPRMNRLGHCTG